MTSSMWANNKTIYLDNAAATPLDSRVIAAMLPYLNDHFGNASSIHSFGARAKELINAFRIKLANLINGQEDEIIFTSGGSEANNLALKGIAFANRHKGNHIIVSSTEHDCVLNACKWLETQGLFISYIPVDSRGVIDYDRIVRIINPKTILVSVMHANNEIGTIQPIQEVGKLCSERKVYFHTDACQSFGKIPLDVVKQDVSLMSLNAHNIYGPKGVGCLYVKRGTPLVPLLHGGGQEFGLRSTTENLAGIVGFVTAAEICIEEMESESRRLTTLRDSLIRELQSRFDGFYLNGCASTRLPNNINFGISGLEGETIRLMLLLDDKGIAVSTGSACSNNDTTKSASHVLQAIGRNQFESRGAIRVSLGRFNCDSDIKYFLDIITNELTKLNPIFSIN